MTEFKGPIVEGDVCWHCLDHILPAPRPRCERCPEECDIEGCDAPGCAGMTDCSSSMTDALSGYWHHPDGRVMLVEKTGAHEYAYAVNGIAKTRLDTELHLRLTRRVYIIHTDPAEVVAELRRPTCHHANPYGCGWDEGRYAAADLVAEKLGVKS